MKGWKKSFGIMELWNDGILGLYKQNTRNKSMISNNYVNSEKYI
jgi:hypothetical protein